MRKLFASLAFLLISTLLATQAIGVSSSPDGLLLRGFESEAAANRRGDQAVLNGVSTTMRVDADLGEPLIQVSGGFMQQAVEVEIASFLASRDTVARGAGP